MPYIGRTLGQGTRSRFLYTATAGQTTFSGSDSQSNTLAYADNNGVDCFQNGVLLKGGGADYTATSGTSVVLTTGASVSDVIEILVYDVFAIADHVKKSGDTMTGALTNIDVNGTELILDADGDTSITSDTDDQIDFKTGGSDRVVINSSGNVGIGTSSPTMPLDVICADNKNIVSRESTSNITNGFEIVSNDSSNQAQFVSNSATGEVNLGAINTNYFLTFSTNGTNERMRIDSSGNVLLGGNSAVPSGSVGGSAFEPAGDNRMILSLGCTTTSNRNVATFRNSNNLVGTINVSGSSTGFNTSSDYRLKENVVTDWDATTRLKQLKPSRFNFKTDKDTTVDGFLAHEVSSIVPEAITGEKDAVDKDGNPEYQGIDQSKLVPLLTKALQEAMAKIETLEAKVTALEGK